MTVLIKSNDAARAGNVRAFGPHAGGRDREPRKRIDPELLALRAEVERLRDEAAEQRAAIAGHEDDLKTAHAKGEAAGRVAGRKEADDGRAALAAKLEAATKSALQRLSDDLSSLERLAGLLAIEGLEKILGPSEDRAEQVLQLIRNQALGLQAQAILRVEVSQDDFPEAAQLAEVETAVGRPGAEVRASADLKSGDCRIKLQLGAVEVGVGQQWGRLREVLAELAEPRAAT